MEGARGNPLIEMPPMIKILVFLQFLLASSRATAHVYYSN